jgi:hypothetical protein
MNCCIQYAEKQSRPHHFGFVAQARPCVSVIRRVLGHAAGWDATAQPARVCSAHQRRSQESRGAAAQAHARGNWQPVDPRLSAQYRPVLQPRGWELAGPSEASCSLRFHSVCPVPSALPAHSSCTEGTTKVELLVYIYIYRLDLYTSPTPAWPGSTYRAGGAAPKSLWRPWLLCRARRIERPVASVQCV